MRGRTSRKQARYQSRPRSGLLEFGRHPHQEVLPTTRRDELDADRETCRALLDDVPDSLGGRERREVEPADALGAAWGDPPIVMTCGGEAPALSPTALCEEANGVGYFVEDAELVVPLASGAIPANEFETDAFGIHGGGGIEFGRGGIAFRVDAAYHLIFRAGDDIGDVPVRAAILFR